MNNKGQTSIYLMLFIAMLIFFAGTIFMNIFKGEIDQARIDNTCSAPTSDGNKVLCLVIDSSMIYFIILFVSVAGGYILDKYII